MLGYEWVSEWVREYVKKNIPILTQFFWPMFPGTSYRFISFRVLLLLVYCHQGIMF